VPQLFRTQYGWRSQNACALSKILEDTSSENFIRMAHFLFSGAARTRFGTFLASSCSTTSPQLIGLLLFSIVRSISGKPSAYVLKNKLQTTRYSYDEYLATWAIHNCQFYNLHSSSESKGGALSLSWPVRTATPSSSPLPSFSPTPDSEPVLLEQRGSGARILNDELSEYWVEVFWCEFAHCSVPIKYFASRSMGGAVYLRYPFVRAIANCFNNCSAFYGSAVLIDECYGISWANLNTSIYFGCVAYRGNPGLMPAEATVRFHGYVVPFVDSSNFSFCQAETDGAGVMVEGPDSGLPITVQFSQFYCLLGVTTINNYYTRSELTQDYAIALIVENCLFVNTTSYVVNATSVVIYSWIYGQTSLFRNLLFSGNFGEAFNAQATLIVQNCVFDKGPLSGRAYRNTTGNVFNSPFDFSLCFGLSRSCMIDVTCPSGTFTVTVPQIPSIAFGASKAAGTSDAFAQARTLLRRTLEADTPSLSETVTAPSDAITPSTAFSSSVVFSPSDVIPPSTAFSSSAVFSPSDVITPSTAFLSSAVFSPSDIVTPSTALSSSVVCSPSAIFTASSPFMGTDSFVDLENPTVGIREGDSQSSESVAGALAGAGGGLLGLLGLLGLAVLFLLKKRKAHEILAPVDDETAEGSASIKEELEENSQENNLSGSSFGLSDDVEEAL
jgi:hypothetical protein